MRSVSSSLLWSLCVVWGVTGCGVQDATAPPPPVRTAVAEPSSAGDQSESASAVSNQTESGTQDADGSGVASSGETRTEIQAFDGMKFAVPSSWKQLPLSQMQQGIIAAKFGIPAVSDDISLTLSTSGGSVEDNINRWQGQFSGGEPMQKESLSANGQDATVVRLQGQFSPGFGRPAESGWCMIGVIIPMAEHNYYVKLTGPQADVAGAEAQFLEFCRSARRE